MGKKAERQTLSKTSKSKCPICMDKNNYASIDCGHRFCMKCIVRWTKVNFKFNTREIKLALSVGHLLLLSNMEKELKISSLAKLKKVSIYQLHNLKVKEE